MKRAEEEGRGERKRRLTNTKVKNKRARVRVPHKNLYYKYRLPAVRRIFSTSVHVLVLFFATAVYHMKRNACGVTGT